MAVQCDLTTTLCSTLLSKTKWPVSLIYSRETFRSMVVPG